MSRPWMPFYVADYLADTRHLEPAEHGVYILLLLEYWTSGSLPNDDAILAKICGISRTKFVKISSKIRKFFYDGWKHKRVEAELKKAREISAKRKDAVNKRHHPDDTIVSRLNTHAGATPQSQSQSQKKRTPIGVSAALAAPAAKRGKNKPMTTFPADFTLTGPRVQVAVDRDLDADATFQDMKRKSIHRGTKSADWDVYWVIWCETQQRINRERPQGRGIAFAINEDGSPVHRDE